jgi:hypothetical protein
MMIQKARAVSLDMKIEITDQATSPINNAPATLLTKKSPTLRACMAVRLSILPVEMRRPK